MSGIQETALALMVPCSQGEGIRRRLIEEGLLLTHLKIRNDGKFLYLPIKNQSESYSSYSVVSMSFEVLNGSQRAYQDMLNLPDELKAFAPSSFDIVGSILLIKIPEELKRFQTEIGQALLKAHHQVETVCDVEPVSGEFRTRDVTVIAGKKSFVTVHTEFGLHFEVDVKHTYFSPRLGGERRRVAKHVKRDEVIVDMFTGIAPFPVMIARYAHPSIIYAIEKNDDAVMLARKNIVRNKCEDQIEVIHGDATHVEKILAAKQVAADRVIMNLPFLSFSFLPYAFHILADQSVIHYYEILDDEQLDLRIKRIRTVAHNLGVTIQTIEIHKIKSYSPREFYIALDITAQKSCADVA